MTGRRSIKKEAEQRTQKQVDQGDDSDVDEETNDQEDVERKQLTQRMPGDLVDDVDKLADRLGISRNAAINMLVEQGLEKF